MQAVAEAGDGNHYHASDESCFGGRVSRDRSDSARPVDRVARFLEDGAGVTESRAFEKKEETMIAVRLQPSHRSKRKGVAAVEFAITAPILFLIFFAMIEFARFNMIRHGIDSAVYEGARRGIVPGATADDVTLSAEAILRAVSTTNATVTVVPAEHHAGNNSSDSHCRGSVQQQRVGCPPLLQWKYADAILYAGQRANRSSLTRRLGA